MKNAVVHIVSITVLLSLAVPVPASAQGLVWPTNAGRVMTSSFGEYRPGHFHAGLDIKTWGREGYDIYALGNGWVSRIVASISGYGRAVYLTLESGETVVYAHLSAFAPGLVPFVREKQARLGRYGVTIFLRPDQFRVSAGDLLGYTGSTGNGVPHLHVEVRDQVNNLVNPFHYGLTVTDNLPPEFIQLAVVPLSADARTDNGFLPALYPAVPTAPGAWEPAAPVRARGRVGLAVAVTDRADGAGNLFSPYRLRLFIDDREWYRVTYDSLRLNESFQVDLDRDYRLRRVAGSDFHRLYRAAGNTLRFCLPAAANAGEIVCGDGDAASGERAPVSPDGLRFRIEAEDFYGNVSILEGRITAAPADTTTPAPESPPPVPDSDFSLGSECYGDAIVYTAVSAAGWREPPLLLVKDSPWLKRAVPLISVDSTSWQGRYRWLREGQRTITAELSARRTGQICRTVSDTISAALIDPRAGGALTSPDGRCSFIFPPGAVYAPVLGRAFQKTLAVRESGTVTVYEFAPRDRIFFRQGTLRLDLPAPGMPSGKAGLYRVINDSTFGFVAPLSDPMRLEAAVSGPAAFAVLQDTVPPSVSGVIPADGAVVRTGTPRIQWVCEDDRSGLGGEDTYTIHIDGKRQIVERLPHLNLCRVILFAPLSPGRHRLKITAEDRAGNVTVHESGFAVSAAGR
ncbi:M23 family metallopeptidase [bacterium]|nr:M23 family metallopeptidase [bacterium]